MSYQAINLRKKFTLFDEQWQPRVIAEMNDYQFKIVKLQGDFIWHDHKETDETFIVIEGDLQIDFRNGAAHVRAGEMFVVPKGVEHKPYAENEVKLLLIEPRVVSGGLFRPFVLAAGRGVGLWRLAGAAVEVTPFEPLAEEVTSALASDGADVVRFLGIGRRA